MNDVYCSNKFNEVQIHVQSRLLYNCCKAWPERINLDLLEKNPGSLFLTPTMKQDRELMLNGQRSKSCEHGCYRYEDQGLISKRLKKEGDQTIITNSSYPITKLDLALSTDCNLTCAYCSSEWSSSWARDLIKNGEYNIKGYDNSINAWHKVWQKTKMSDRSWNSRFNKLLIEEIKMAKSLKHIEILGGEPLLNDYIFDLIESNPEKSFGISTGLGVSEIRFLNFVEKIKDKKNIRLSLSSESTKQFFEFLRFGIKWKNFLAKIELLEKKSINFHFNSVITNLATFDVFNFYNLFGKKYKIRYGNVTGKSFLLPNVLDDESKKICLEQIGARNEDFFVYLKKEIMQPYNDNERIKLSIFLKKFSSRRGLKLDIFPQHFLQWLDIV